MPGRTVINKWGRVYGDGFPWSGYTRDIGVMGAAFDEVDLTVLLDPLHSFLPGQALLSFGPLNANMDNTATESLHVTASSPGVNRQVFTAIGIRTEPVAGDSVFSAKMLQTGYTAAVSGQDANVSAVFTPGNPGINYDNPWGRLLHADGAETVVNSSTSDVDHGAATAFGGYMAYQLLSSNGTVTLKVQDADTDANPNFSDLVSSGVIDASATPAADQVELSKTATVEQYLRWQMVLGTATTATFLISFSRARA